MAKDFFRTIILQIRGPFLILSIVLVAIGAAAARVVPPDPVNIVLLLIGVSLAHISVNLFNEVSDFKTEIDSNTQRTPFSGGSGMLQTGATSVKSVTIAAYGSLFGAVLLGLYFTFVSGWLILPLMLIGGLSIRFYTSYLTKHYLGELFAGFTLGTLVVIGAFYALTGNVNTEIIFISIPPGILTSLLLFVNEIPDAEADMQGGRRHLVILFGKKNSCIAYSVGLASAYILIAVSVFFIGSPKTMLIAFLTIPLAIRAIIITSKYYNTVSKLIPAMGLNVAVVIFTDLLIAIGLVM